jgi:hypothetical protein
MVIPRWGHASVALWLPLCLLSSGPLNAGPRFWLQNGSCSAGYDPFTLEVVLGGLGRPQTLVSVAQTNLGRVANADWGTLNPSKARWSLPDRKVSLSFAVEGNRLVVHVVAAEPGEFTFPILPASAPAKGWILPLFEGVYAPCGDTNWERFLTNHAMMNTTADFIMPFVGLEYSLPFPPRPWTLTCILTNPFNNQLQFVRAPGNTLQARVTHQFTRNHPVKEYSVIFEAGTNSLVEPARRYRQWLLERGEFFSFKDKMGKTPEAEKLLGAAHAYLWGTGVSTNMIQQLAAAGLDRLWLGSDGWKGFLERPETVAAAKKAGFLIAPYDSYHSIHRPGEPDTWETAQFDAALYETGAIVKADGSKRRGFKQKGFLLSPDAARPYVEKRVSSLMGAFHANSWFIDCDGFGEYFDDYSERHPATQQSDMQACIARMAWIRDTYGAIIGTEGCSAGVAATVHFAHGVLTPVVGWGDPDLKDRQSPYYLGGYYPPEQPQVFFKPVPLKEEYRYIYFEPRFRLPLFQTVFHDSVIATHHWSFASLKAKDEARIVELLELLYQVPPLYHLNVPEFQKRRAQIKRHYDFFSPLHRETALLPMTDFQWLTPDGAVQRTVFGDKVELVANFGARDVAYGDAKVAPVSILVKRRGSANVQAYFPLNTPSAPTQKVQ